MTSFARLVVAVLALGVPLVAVAGAGAGKGGPSPGVLVGGKGIANADGTARYVARVTFDRTTVTAFDANGNQIRRGTVAGQFGIPRVAFDGSLDGLAHDGRTLVLALPGSRRGTDFAVLSTTDLRLRRLVTFPGVWSFDALSPDGRKLYLVEHNRGGTTYRVRAYDLLEGRLLREAVIDPRLGGRSMSGAPVTRALGPRGVWAYTLYQKPGGLPFVHALDTVRGKALCIELPWRGNQVKLFDVRMRVRGRTLVLSHRTGTSLARIDTRAFVVHAHHNPLGAPAASSG